MIKKLTAELFINVPNPYFMKKHLLKIQVTLVFLFSMLVAQTFAINYYVDPSSTTTTANGSLASPWKTIAQVNSGTTALLIRA
jgi:hypothetical protein